ncbi:MAG TPA: MoxR family ATPase [Chitinophagales bacterium]|jgi:MoxR-like ATPase|nr:MoxR family ATPase [Chitinophagales bacterium]HQV79096.1 MoxR family ATPase [Chitinophagales bacterium]HQW79780.1 MoxR family ATPase [Chitinophagales bacterium]HRB19507.1 MoxR family ATPase [Chitinophagales bacterium]HRB67568.1 MoxR family ATPase [Chitinophagales bacterium]
MEDIQQTTDNTEIQFVSSVAQKIKKEMAKVIIGQENAIDLMLSALFIGGHILIEGVPGIAKTLTAKTLAKTIESDFSRIQFTPDLMPTDIIGTSVFNIRDSEFTFKAGPVFSNIILIDEINRSPAKTQAALFELMEEKQVSVDGITYPMSYPFMVLATQNPIEQEGTYRLPEAQLDRFIFRIIMEYPNFEEEKQILYRFNNDFNNNISKEVKTVVNANEIKRCSELVEQVFIKDEIINYIAQVVYSTRNHGDLFLGASPRASLSLLKSSKAFAAISGRNFVTPDDVRTVSSAVLNHRIIPSPEKEMEGITAQDIIQQIIQKIEVPR